MVKRIREFSLPELLFLIGLTIILTYYYSKSLSPVFVFVETNSETLFILFISSSTLAILCVFIYLSKDYILEKLRRNIKHYQYWRAQRKLWSDSK